MRCAIVSNGDITNYAIHRKIIDDCDYVVCADGGARHLRAMGIYPNAIVGDLDSMGDDEMVYFRERDIEFYKFPARKDYTDSDLAIQYALEKGCTEILMLGCIGSRMDHTLANITMLLPLLEQGIQARIVDEHNEIFVINDSALVEGEPGRFVSLIPLSATVEGITLSGFEYPLNNATLKMGSSLGISNQLKEQQGCIRLRSGNLLVILAKD
ncbi:thiamine pyrophosphokinase [Anaerosolibacter carboniphilus]|uniref:Thiamine diphosphokinase n=1 Tax=Anaerosolibacter carboniphilus TaxID=1417629 RepID=A0A841KXG3_9FIRM|nr:thiamine diphosphokinase [Anaerosolibacter carboniphilus]MBB6216948.1 thiamine pyrophosphokinase [Anaerosolibacter carboniphilus]